MRSRIRPAHVAAITLTVAFALHWISAFWFSHTRPLFAGLGPDWRYPVSVLCLGLVLTGWSPRAFGLQWAQTWRERRTVLVVGGGMTLVAVVGMLFIPTPFYGGTKAVYVCVPAAEELLFRAFIFGVLQEPFSQRLRVGRQEFSVAVVICAVAFGVWHLGGLAWPQDGFTLFQVAYTTVAGFFAALLRERTGSVVAPWAVHAVVNAWAVEVPGFWA